MVVPVETKGLIPRLASNCRSHLKRAMFFLTHLNDLQMETKNEKHVTMQLVDLNHHKFAVQLMNGNVNVNLTQMSGPFGRSKRPENWLKSDEAKDYLNTLSVATKIATVDLLKVKKGGTNQGTFCTDYRIAMRFAQWLSTDFAIAVDDLLVRLLTRQAIFTQDFNGVPPVASGGKLWYNYREVLKTLGFRRYQGLSFKRNRVFTDQFTMFYGRNFITLGFCHFLKQRSDYEGYRLPFLY
jgi:KilA-N domain